MDSIKTQETQPKLDSKEDLIAILNELSNDNPNDQILGYKLRTFLTALGQGQILNTKEIKFIN
jgi:hypothetical protein